MWLNVNKIYALLQMQWIIEWRQKAMFSAMLMYPLTTIMILYFINNASHKVEILLTLFWITILFTAVQITLKSNNSLNIFSYLLYRPEIFIISRIIYNIFQISILCTIIFTIFYIIFDIDIINLGLFIIIVFLGSYGLIITFTLMSVLSNNTVKSTLIMPILSFPIIIPFLLLIVKLSFLCAKPFFLLDVIKPLLSLLTLDIAVFCLSILLFPYLWTE